MEAETEITVAAAAARLGRSRQAVLRRIARGTLPARRDERGHYLIHRANLTTKGTTK
jgi:excisionase family DNA binding protein